MLVASPGGLQSFSKLFHLLNPENKMGIFFSLVPGGKKNRTPSAKQKWDYSGIMDCQRHIEEVRNGVLTSHEGLIAQKKAEQEK